ncbi:MAG: hypothetical protein IKT65_01520 [Clostridia bacterium]|nr:hypothetical protein [Clostridia bacterium]
MANLNLLEKLSAAKQRYEALLEELALPETVKDISRFKELGREQKRLAPIV